MASACGIIVNAAVYKRDFKHYALGVGLSVLLVLICLISKKIMGLGDGLAILMTGCVFNSKHIYEFKFAPLNSPQLFVK